MVTSVFADVEKTNESTQSENQSFDKTTFSEESITSETTESQSEAPTSNTRQEENKTSETSEVAEQTSDSSEEVQVRVVSADGYSAVSYTHLDVYKRQVNNYFIARNVDIKAFRAFFYSSVY